MDTHQQGAIRNDRELSRRAFLRGAAFAAVSPALGGIDSILSGNAHTASETHVESQQAASGIVEMSIAQLQQAMQRRKITAEQITSYYIARINDLDSSGHRICSVLEINPDALAIAAALDQERRTNGPRGPLHGIPILLKDNIDTADQLLTTAGSLALIGSRPAQDATVARRLRDAGAIILGKANMSEWAGGRSLHLSSGWSGRGRQCRNPNVLARSPWGSSSGSAAAVAASFCAAALGTETDGSIVDPASACGVVGIKPTVGLVSRAGVIPIAHSQDSVGPHGRTVSDAAAMLGALVGLDARDPATRASAGKFFNDYTQFLDPNGLKGARIGVTRTTFWGYSVEADAICEEAIAAMRAAGAVIIDPADIPTAQEIVTLASEIEVLLYEFKNDLNQYLATRVPDPRFPDLPVLRSLGELIAFNEAHASEEMPYFGQELFLMSQATGSLTDPIYLEALARAHRISREEGIDAVMDRYQLDALIAPTGPPAWTIDLIDGDHVLGSSSSPAAIAGYPLISVPAGYMFGLPVGITFMGRAYSEPTLIRLAYAFEQATQARHPPQYLPALDLP